MTRIFIFILLLFSPYVFAMESFGWRSVPVYGKYVPEGDGWRIVGEISRLTDTDTGEFVGFNFFRDFRSYFILQNHGQPIIEAWDFPLNCPGGECPDSKLARVVFVPYLDNKMMGDLTGEKDEARGVFQISINETPILTVIGETMEISDGIIKEDLSRMPEMLRDPAISCSTEISCIRSLAFGKLGYEDLAPKALSTVFFRTGEQQIVPNLILFKPRPDYFANPLRLATEKDLVDAARQHHTPH